MGCQIKYSDSNFEFNYYIFIPKFQMLDLMTTSKVKLEATLKFLSKTNEMLSI